MGRSGGSPFQHRRRQATRLARQGAAFVIEHRIRPLRWLGVALLVLGLFPLVQGPRWVGVLLVVTGALLWLVVSAAVRMAQRLLTPRPPPNT